MTIYKFIATAYALRNDPQDRREYFALIREILSLPAGFITFGKPRPKE